MSGETTQPSGATGAEPLFGIAGSISGFYLRAWLVFGAMRAISLAVHFWGPSPWGGPTVLDPWRLAPDAILFEAGLTGVVVWLFAALEVATRRVTQNQSAEPAFAMLLRLAALFVLTFLHGLAQFDQEVVRWMAQHVSTSFLNNFFGVRDPQLLSRILTNDRGPTGWAVFSIFAGPVVAGWLFVRRRRYAHPVNQRTAWAMLLLAAALVTLPAWFRPSEKRWRRIRPAAVAIAVDGARQFAGADRPRDEARAIADLRSYVATGRLDQPLPPPADPNYPLATNMNLGRRSAEELRAAPRTARPNIVVIVFETMRAWNTGWIPDANLPGQTPRLDGWVLQRGAYFPWTHSAGYPSVEGNMGMHLGFWPHFRKIVFSDYLHIHTRAFPEYLADLGYARFALLGADPSFSNFTPWMKRWYGDVEYDPTNHHDGPLVDRMIAKLDGRLDDETPTLALLWTATTHPPYDVPASEGITIADTDEGRFVQAMGYADKQLGRLVDWMSQQPGWDNTVVVILGDHAQPVPWQRQHPELAGPLTPGHTWTSMAFIGGWPGLPSPGVRSVTASHIDLPATLLSMLDLKVTNSFMGRNLFSPDPRMSGERPVFSFRDGEVAVAEGDLRIGFRIDGTSATAWRVEHDDKRSYGMLDAESVHRLDAVPQGFDVERYRDMARAWAELLDENRVLQPEPPR